MKPSAFLFLLAIVPAMALQSECGSTVFVSAEVEVINVGPSMNDSDCLCRIETSGDRVLMLSMIDFENSVEIYDGPSLASERIRPQLDEARHVASPGAQPSSSTVVYSSNSVVIVSLSSKKKLRIEIRPAVKCHANIGAYTSCKRLHLDGGCHCAVQIKRSWSLARAYCETYQMQLVSIETKEEDQAILKKWPIKDASQEQYWTSGSDFGHEGLWVWTSTGKSFTYTNWAQDEPNNGGGDQNYLTMGYGSDRKWDDERETRAYPSICEARL